MSLLRPGTFFTWRAFTTYTAKPRASRISYTGIQYTPVDSMATVSTPQAVNQSAKACRSGVKVPNLRTGSAVRSGGTAAQISSLPMSRPAALGWITFRPSQVLPCDCLRPMLSPRPRERCGLRQTRSGPIMVVCLAGSALSPNAATILHITPDQNQTQKRAVTLQGGHGLIGRSLKHRTNALVIMLCQQRAGESGGLEIGLEVRGKLV